METIRKFSPGTCVTDNFIEKVGSRSITGLSAVLGGRVDTFIDTINHNIKE